MIQAGVIPRRRKSGFPAITLERTNVTGLLHKDGAISMARGTPDSATSGWFICINDQPSLDFGGQRNPDGQGFAAFGRVVSGMDVVRKIQQAPSSADRKTNTEAQRLTPPIKILKVARVPVSHGAGRASWSWPRRCRRAAAFVHSAAARRVCRVGRRGRPAAAPAALDHRDDRSGAGGRPAGRVSISCGRSRSATPVDAGPTGR